MDSISNTIKQYIRVLKLARRPSMEEFLTISKVAGAGIVLIGVIGFIIYMVMVLIPQTLT